jgi:hypothetical protein
MDARIRPEPTDAQRRAILAAVARARRLAGHPAYASPWRRAALGPVEAETDPEGPGQAGPRGSRGANE